jgi:hypothetical protein
MPPQQGEGLLDVFDAALDLGAHGTDIGRAALPVKMVAAEILAPEQERRAERA